MTSEKTEVIKIRKKMFVQQSTILGNMSGDIGTVQSEGHKEKKNGEELLHSEDSGTKKHVSR